MRRQKEVSLSVLGSRARWFESVPERTNAKDPAPLKVKEVWVKERRYIVCLNEEERRKDAHDREAIVAHLREQLRCGDKSLVGNKGYRRYLKVEGSGHFVIDKNKSKPTSATTASGSYALTPSITPRRWLTFIRHCGRSRRSFARLNRSLKLVPSTTSAM